MGLGKRSPMVRQKIFKQRMLIVLNNGYTLVHGVARPSEFHPAQLSCAPFLLLLSCLFLPNPQDFQRLFSFSNAVYDSVEGGGSTVVNYCTRIHSKSRFPWERQRRTSTSVAPERQVRNPSTSIGACPTRGARRNPIGWNQPPAAAFHTIQGEPRGITNVRSSVLVLLRNRLVE